jgi:hypothetical protein
VRKPRRPPAPLERQSQQTLFEWAALSAGRHPELAALYAIPNAGGFTGTFKSNMLRVVAMKREGVKKGVPDIHLPVARGGYHSLYIELKREYGGKGTTDEQVEWAKKLVRYGNRVVVAHGFEEARAAIEEYLALKKSAAA